MNYYDVLRLAEFDIPRVELSGVCLDAPDLFPCGATHQREIVEDLDGDYFRVVGFEADIGLIARPGLVFA